MAAWSIYQGIRCDARRVGFERWERDCRRLQKRVFFREEISRFGADGAWLLASGIFAFFQKITDGVRWRFAPGQSCCTILHNLTDVRAYHREECVAKALCALRFTPSINLRAQAPLLGSIDDFGKGPLLGSIDG